MINLVPCRRCKKLPLLTLRYDAKNYADIRCDCTRMSTPHDPTGEKTAKWWNEHQEPPVVTNLEWIKQPERTAEEAVDFIRGLCTEAAKADWCDAFDGDCRACLIAYLLAKRKEG